MLPALSVLIELQALDTAIDAARKKLADFPVAEKRAGDGVRAATAALDAAKTALSDANAARKVVEKDVAAVDSRLARFEEHKASVKTNEQFHALQHETEVSKQEKATLEEKVLEMMMAADDLTARVNVADAALAKAKKELAAVQAQFAAEKGALEAEIASLVAQRAAKTPGVDKPTLAKYEQLLKGRKGLALAEMTDGRCTVCHMSLRPVVQAQIKRNDSIATCESCQRIMYFVPPVAEAPVPDPAQ